MNYEVFRVFEVSLIAAVPGKAAGDGEIYGICGSITARRWIYSSFRLRTKMEGAWARPLENSSTASFYALGARPLSGPGIGAMLSKD